MTTKIDDHICDFKRGRFWHTFEYLENSLIEASKYVTIDPRNKDTWSEALATLLVLNCNAVDTFFRNMIFCPNIRNNEIFKKINKPEKKKDWYITHFQKIIEPIHELSENTIDVPFGLGAGQKITPFKDFSSKTPEWWNAYNHVKHDYYESITEAKLSNVINSLWALLLLHALHRCSSIYLINQNRILSEWNLSKSGAFNACNSDIGIINRFSGFPFYIITKIFVFKYRFESG